MRAVRDEAITTGMHYLMYQYTHEEDIRGAGMKQAVVLGIVTEVKGYNCHTIYHSTLSVNPAQKQTHTYTHVHLSRSAVANIFHTQ